MLWIYIWLASLLQSRIFDSGDGNDDWRQLVDPTNYQLTQTQNLYLSFPRADGTKGKDRIGAWFIRAATDASLGDDGRCTKEKCPDDVLVGVPKLTADDTILILLHGNAKNRGASHRLAAYRLFQQHGYYTLTLDYRGYDGYDGVIGETSVVEDAIRAIRFLREQVGEAPTLVLYGHSMGTGIASRAAAICARDGLARIDGIILDSPFHSIRDTLERSGKSMKIFNLILNPISLMNALDAHFDSVSWLTRHVKCPVTVFHARVDPVIPLAAAERLVNEAKAARVDIELIRFEAEGLAHIGISKDPGFPEAVMNAVTKAMLKARGDH